jgi:hypothetical protein
MIFLNWHGVCLSERGILVLIEAIRSQRGPFKYIQKKRGKMNIKIRNVLFAVVGILSLTIVGPNNLLARDVTIVGEINDRDELVSSEDGTVYELAEGDIADKLIFEHRGEKMRVFGKLIKPVQEYSVDELPKALIEVFSFEDVPE